MSNLLDQWNEHIVRGNQLSRELEDIESLLERAKDADICFSSGSNGAVFIRVLSPEKMQELKENAVIAVIRARDDKTAELEKLMGVRKPATINPEFEAAVQSMTQSVKNPDPNGYGGLVNPAAFQGASAMKAKRAMNVVPDPVEKELTEIHEDKAKKTGDKQPVPLRGSEILEAHADEVLKMYNQMETYQAIADKFGVKKTDVNNFFTKHKTTKRTGKKDDGFLDSKVEAKSEKEGP